MAEVKAERKLGKKETLHVNTKKPAAVLKRGAVVIPGVPKCIEVKPERVKRKKMSGMQRYEWKITDLKKKIVPKQYLTINCLIDWEQCQAINVDYVWCEKVQVSIALVNQPADSLFTAGYEYGGSVKFHEKYLPHFYVKYWFAWNGTHLGYAPLASKNIPLEVMDGRAAFRKAK